MGPMNQWDADLIRMEMEPAVPPAINISVAGITLRDCFAAFALAGIVARPDTEAGLDAITRTAYGMADAMLLRRERR